MNTHNWEIRPAREGDLGEIMVMERETSTAPHWSAAEYSAALRPASGVKRCLYVASEGIGLAGFAVGHVVGIGPDTEAALESVVVREGMRRQGLGSALCRAVMEWSERQGAAAILLEVRAASPWALRLYSGLGFVAAGRRPKYYHHPADDALVMRCGLSGGRMAGPVDRGEPVLF